MTGSFDSFMLGVKQRNRRTYTEEHGNSHVTFRRPTTTLQFVVWKDVFPFFRGAHNGAEILRVDYGFHRVQWYRPFRRCRKCDRPISQWHVLNSTGDAALEVRNPDGGHDLTLDMSDMLRPRRISEDGEVEHAGAYSEVSVDFDWQGPTHGDACQPMSDLRRNVPRRGWWQSAHCPESTATRASLGNGRRWSFPHHWAKSYWPVARSTT